MDIRKMDDPTLEAEPCEACGTILVAECRHKAPCGAICIAGSAIGADRINHNEKMHVPPRDLPPETDGHYHGECPNGCFKDCCKEPGKLCGERCLQCFGCKVCGYIHPSGMPHHPRQAIE